MNQISSLASLNTNVKSICKIMRRSNAAGALQYIPILSWLLFLRVLDEREESEQNEALAIGVPFTPSLSYPYRWQDWASNTGQKRIELQNGTIGETFKFINQDLLPHLKSLKDKPNATPRQKIISEIVSSIESAGLDTERNFLNVIDKVDDIRQQGVDSTHIFTLSQVYEGLLLKMGEKNNDGGQFFTPREVIRAIVKVVNPKIGETIYDPAAGTGGFLVQAHQYIRASLGKSTTEQEIQLAKSTLFGREKEKLIYPITLANLVLHGIDEPNIWHGNTLTKNETYGGLFTDAPQQFDIVLMNPPFGGEENIDAQTNYPYKTSSTQVLFLQEIIISSLTSKGRAGIVVDEGLLSRDERAFVQAKRKLIEECDLWCIVSLPAGVFISAGAGVKTNLLFFNKGDSTQKIWYYDLSDIKVNKGNPLTLAHFDKFFQLLPTRADSPKSWTVTLQQIVENNYNLKAVNPNRVEDTDTRTPTELLDLIEQKTQTIQTTLAKLRQNP